MRRMFTALLLLLCAFPSSALAHEGDETGNGKDEEGYDWGENPKDILMAQDCANTQMNFSALYQLEYRLDSQLAARADRLEVVAEEAWVPGFTIAAQSWKAHPEVEAAVAHADRKIPGDPERGPLLRIGLERKDPLTPETTGFVLRVRNAATGDFTELTLSANRMPDGYGSEPVMLYRQWCYEPLVSVVTAPTSVSVTTLSPNTSVPPTETSTVPVDKAVSGGFPLFWISVGVAGILLLTSLIRVRRRQRW